MTNPDEFTDDQQSGPFSPDDGRSYPEKALQIFICNNPQILEIDDAEIIRAEYQTEVGRIDILIASGDSTLWVVELKAGIAGRDAIGQITSYIGAIRNKFPKKIVFGLLIAEDFDKPCLAAHRVISDVELKKYVINYALEDVAPMVVHKKANSVELPSVVVDTIGNSRLIRCPDCGTERLVSVSALGVNCASCKRFIKISGT